MKPEGIRSPPPLFPYGKNRSFTMVGPRVRAQVTSELGINANTLYNWVKAQNKVALIHFTISTAVDCQLCGFSACMNQYQ